MRRVVVLASLAALVCAAILYWVLVRGGVAGSVGRLGGVAADARAPAGVRVKVEVLNASRIRGLARHATMHLRDRGFDVVETATVTEQRENTLVIDRSGHPEWASAVAKAMGGAATQSQIDSTRYLDVTVLVGSGWRPPSDPFYP
ncbi:MAG: LytR C-terminal domain-containing protein [Gemmatimonadaceae bacterium]